MTEQNIEVADVFRLHGADYLDTYADSTFPQQRTVLEDIIACRTAALGGHVENCNQCDHKQVVYCSCRNRHCPKCHAAARAKWLQARAEDLLDGVQYFHVVFTISDKINPIALQNKRVVYKILFRSVAETLHTIARDPKHLGAEIGFLAALHTWGQTILDHPHIHCVVPGGGISADGTRWISCREDFFLPVEVLSCLFKKKFLSYLNEAVQNGEISFHGKQARLGKKGNWKRFLKSLKKDNWVVYAKPPFGGAEQVLKYLARYTHRVAISNQRLISLEDGKVTFRWKDYKNGNKKRTMTLDAVEFIRRFLLHVFPPGFMQIRHYGFLSNRTRKEKIVLCRKLLGNTKEPDNSVIETIDEQLQVLTDTDRSKLCPACKKGHMLVVETFKPDAELAGKLIGLLAHDSG